MKNISKTILVALSEEDLGVLRIALLNRKYDLEDNPVPELAQKAQAAEDLYCRMVNETIKLKSPE